MQCGLRFEKAGGEHSGEILGAEEHGAVAGVEGGFSGRFRGGGGLGGLGERADWETDG